LLKLFMVQWFNGSMVQWFNGSMVQWFNGSMVQWFNRVWWVTSRGYGIKVYGY
jgi:hypothetical protein